MTCRPCVADLSPKKNSQVVISGKVQQLFLLAFSRREEVKKLTCILTSLAVVTFAYLPAHAAFTGVLRGDQDWQLIVSNSSSNPTGVTVYFLDRGVNVELLETLAPGATLNRTIPKAPSR